jgi:protein TonB
MPEVRITAVARSSETFEPKEKDDVFCPFVFAAPSRLSFASSSQPLIPVKIQPSNGVCTIRLRHSPPPTPPQHHRGLASALLVAVAAHVALLAILASVPLRFTAPATKAMPIAVQFTFAGMADSDGNLNAGGQTPVAVPTAPVRLVTVVAAPAPVPDPEDFMESTSSVADEPANPSPDSALLDGSIAQPGSGLGHGTGTGVGDDSGDGVVGTGGSGRGGFGGAHPDYLRIPQPHYPTVARQNGWQGRTILRVEIRSDGHVGTVEILHSSGYAMLDNAAVEAVRAGEFMPAHAGGKPVSSSVEVPIRFQLVDRQS